MLFFLLSGFVLSVPYLRGKGQAYPVYLIRRILRIYAPFLAALALAVLGANKWHSSLGFGSWADQTWSTPVDAHLVVAHILMLGYYNSTQFNTAFWSIIVEMRISLIFPFLFLLVRRVSVATSLSIAGICLLIAAFIPNRTVLIGPMLDTVEFVAAFIFGILLVTHVEPIGAWYKRLNPLARFVFVIGSGILYTFGHHFAAFTLKNSRLADEVFAMAGALGYFVIALNSRWAFAVLHTRIGAFLGRISYSLYLIHGTVLFALAHLLGKNIPVLAAFLIYLPASLLVAYLFCLGVEEPFLRMSRAISKAASERLSHQPESLAK